MDFPLPMAFKIGLFQCLALVPGVSRSGATIVGALLLGADKRSAAEFSFFLSMPTMAGAFAFDLYKNRDVLSFDDATLIAIGFVAAFVAAVIVVRGLLDFVSRRGYAVFGWWRIVVGVAALVALLGGKIGISLGPNLPKISADRDRRAVGIRESRSAILTFIAKRNEIQA